MKIYADDKSELMDIAKLKRDGSDLLIKGKVFGAMPMSARLTPEEFRSVFKLLSVSLFFFIISMMFRKSSVKKAKS
jgi:hypothetical protein